MVGWYHRLNRHEFEQTPEDSEGQGSLACCSPWGPDESAMTQQLNNNNRICVAGLPVVTVKFLKLCYQNIFIIKYQEKNTQENGQKI